MHVISQATQEYNYLDSCVVKNNTIRSICCTTDIVLRKLWTMHNRMDHTNLNRNSNKEESFNIWTTKGKQRKACDDTQVCMDRVYAGKNQITFETDIILVVKVPVLSLHITVVQPKVSTEGKDLTIALRRAIRLVPRAKHLQAEHESYNLSS